MGQFHCVPSIYPLAHLHIDIVSNTLLQFGLTDRKLMAEPPDATLQILRVVHVTNEQRTPAGHGQVVETEGIGHIVQLDTITVSGGHQEHRLPGHLGVLQAGP